MIYNIGQVQRNGLKIDESEVNDIVNNYVHQYCESVRIFYSILQYIYKVYIRSHSRDVFCIINIKLKPPPNHIEYIKETK
jgi:hypothetical protein